ncbi:phosphodiester glycosidase family protein [Roseofilum capinflatum]|uniref:Phosphodiester glycosidase family protein n=1 Tax=Roseofilum capinflatum BLCC-M114 TaxID=3022440 RepID=A0ABT7BAQ4_9CYAN|nr:phosphodiester glycosidase family protein [Roseofilum capinflatum]MDJ1176260.1 phosphodiester glycosidase family protein [Roseofilum capinflatum BLCC-M114]
MIWQSKKLGKIALIIIALLLGIPGGIYGILLLSRPARTPLVEELFPGVTYTRLIRSTPRPLVIHQVKIDLSTAQMQPLVTPGDSQADGMEISARTTSEFVRELGVQLAINGSFFYPFEAKSPWQVYPESGDRVRISGQAIANGIEYSPVNGGWPVLCFLSSPRAVIPGSDACPPDTQQGIAGGTILIWDGEAVPLSSGSFYDDAYPRTAIGLDASGTQVFILVVDGRQRFYSEGMALPELQALFVELGVETALNLDGGGSTTLVVADPHLRVLNAPIHTRIPLRQRAVGNHLGFKD